MSDAPHPFTLRQLQYAAAVADERSFRKAAERCAVSQPALSAQLASLEEGLGVRLFERDRRRVLPTAAGVELLGRVRPLLVAADDLAAAAKGHRDPLAGPLSIGVIPTVAPYLLPAIAPAIRKKLPRLDVRWLEEKTPDLLARLAAGTIDAALLALEVDLGPLESLVIAEDPFLLAAAPTHPLAVGGDAKLSELRGEPVLLLEEGHCLREQALELCTRVRAREAGFRSTSLATLVQMVAAGAGVTLLPALAVEAEGRRAGLRVRRFAAPPPFRTIGLVHRRSAAAAVALREVAKVAKANWPKSPAARSAARR